MGRRLLPSTGPTVAISRGGAPRGDVVSVVSLPLGLGVFPVRSDASQYEGAPQWRLRPDRTPDRRPGYELLVLFILIVWNSAANLLAPEGWEVPLAIAVIAVLVFVGQQAGLSVADMGLESTDLRCGTRWGFRAGGVIAAVLVVAALIPPLLDIFADARFGDVAGTEALYELFVRIPIATALAEEVAFRGVVLGLFLLWFSPRQAVIFSSVLFGLWHVLPGLEALDTAEIDDSLDSVQGGVIAVAGQVLVTAFAGAVFAWLRIRGRHVVAAAIPHWMLNGVAYGIGWLAVQNGWA